MKSDRQGSAMPTKGKIIVEVKEGRDFAVADRTGSSDPYVIVTLGGKKKKTKVKKKTLNPQWNEAIIFDIDPNTLEDEIVIQVFDYDRFSSDDKLGSLKIPITAEIKSGRTVSQWYTLSDTTSGAINISIQMQTRLGIGGMSSLNLIDRSTSKEDLMDSPRRRPSVDEGSPHMSPHVSPQASSGNLNISGSNSASGSSFDSPKSRHVVDLPSVPRSESGEFVNLKYPEATVKLKALFNLSSQEEVIEYYPCSFRSRAGHMFITNQHIYFYARKRKEEIKEAIAFNDVVDLVKQNTALLLPTGIEVHTADAKYLFHGFSNRDHVYKILKSSKSTDDKKIHVAKRSEAETPLFKAVMNNNVDEVKALLQSPTAKEEINWQDKFGFTVLHSAVSNPNVAIIKLLLGFEHTNLNLINNDGNTPLHYFCQKFKSPDDCQEIMDIFLNSKTVDINARNRIGEAPLHKAVFNNAIRLLLVESLLAHKANVNILTASGETPLHYAVRLGRKDLVHVLVMYGADITIKGNKDNKTPYELALQWGYEDIAGHIKKVQDLKDWLAKIDMSDYFPVFVKEELFLEECESLNEQLLERLGIKTSGQQLRILNAVKQLVSQKAKAKSPAKDIPIVKVTETAPIDPKQKQLQALRDRTSTINLQKQLSEMDYVNLGSASWINSSDLEFTKKLGAGTSGKVYQGLYKGNEVAIKVLKEMTEEEQVQEFKKEFQINCSIKHPHVVQFYGACLEPKLCMVMELCSQGSLYHVLKKDFHMDWEKAFLFMIDVAAGILALHSHVPPIYHRDVKTLNFLVNKDFRSKVCDFGLSRFNTTNNLATMNKICGTVSYLAPEVYSGEMYSSKADIYSLSIVLWEVVNRTIKGTYETPYHEYNFKFDWQILLGVTQNNQRPTIPSECPSELEELIKRMASGDPSLRPELPEVLNRLNEIKQIYRIPENKARWDALLPAPVGHDSLIFPVFPSSPQSSSFNDGSNASATSGATTGPSSLASMNYSDTNTASEARNSNNNFNAADTHHQVSHKAGLNSGTHLTSSPSSSSQADLASTVSTSPRSN